MHTHYLVAVPSFARNLGLDCTTCHTAFPQLTEFGKIFLETGGDLLIQKDYGMVSMTPNILSGLINLRPIDKKISDDSTTKLSRKEKQLRLRAFHEVSTFLAGRVGKFYYFAEFEAEDEWMHDHDEGFDFRFSEGFAMYRMFENFNIFAGYDSPFTPDGNDTVQHHNVLKRQWKAADYTPGTSQMFGINGTVNNFYWIAAWHGDDDLGEGNDPKNMSLRLAYNYKHHTFGGYFTRAYHYDSVSERSKYLHFLYGVDAHLRFTTTNVLMLFGTRKLHNLKRDFDFSIEANKIITVESELFKKFLTSFVPIANIDYFLDREQSAQKWVKGSVGIIFYFNPAIRLFPQFIGTIKAPSKFTHRDRTFIISLDIGI